MDTGVSKKIDEFFSQYNVREYRKGQILVFAQEEPRYVFQLVEGNVRQYDISAHGDEIVVNIFKPRAFFPMSWAINKTPNTYFYETTSTVKLRQADPEKTVEFLRANPDVLFDLLSRVYRGTDGLLGRMAHLMGGSATARVVYELVISCERFGEKDTKTGYVIPINESTLATLTGLSRETVNREVRKLAVRKLVEPGRTGIRIHNLDNLRSALAVT